jgi:phosphocarrier protein
VIEREVVVANRLGLHARAAARFVHAASAFAAHVLVAKDGARVDGKSILGLLTLAAARGTRLRLLAEGEDATQALDRLVDLVEGRFEEED